MKRKFLFLLFVIGIVTIAPSIINAQNKDVEERSEIIDQVRKSNTIRFTLEVERDSALCLPQTKARECYVQSQKFKKYVYVDISKTPNITDSFAKKAFSNPGYMYGINGNGRGSDLTDDFKMVDIMHTYSGFPWLKMRDTQAKGYYYFYNQASLSMQKEIRMETVRGTTAHMYIFWIIFLIILIAGVLSFLSNTFDLFENADWLAITTLSMLFVFTNIGDANDFGRLPLYPWLFITCGVIAIIFCKKSKIAKNDGGNIIFNREDHTYSYKSLLYFVFSISSILALIFWSANKWTLYYNVLPYVLMIISIIVIINIRTDNYQNLLSKLQADNN